MAIADATFVVQRGDEHFSCTGSELEAKLLDDDLLIAQRGETYGNIVKANIQDADLFIVTDEDNGHKSVTGAQVKALFAPDGAGEINTLGVVWTPGTKEMTCVKTEGGAGLDPSHANFFKVEIDHPELDLNDYYF